MELQNAIPFLFYKILCYNNFIVFRGDIMSITNNVFYIGEDAVIFMNEMINSGVVDEIRKVDGILKYEYFVSSNDSNIVLLVDSFINQEALDNYHRSEVMKKVMEIRNKYDLKMEVKKYCEIENTSNDLKFIIK